MCVCPFFLREKSSYFVNQVAELNIYWHNKQCEFLSNNVLILNPINEITQKMF